MKIWDYTTDDVDELSAHLAKVGSDNEVIQLTAGKLGFRTCVIELPGASIIWNRFDQSLLFRQVIKPDGLRFGFLLYGSPPLRHSGSLIPAGQGIMQAPCSEHEYVSGKQTESLIVNVASDITSKLGWHTSTDVTHRVRKSFLKNLTDQCRKINAAAQCKTPIDRLAEQQLRDGLLDHLSLALEPWLASGKNNTSNDKPNMGAYWVFRRALKAVSKNQWDTLSVPVLAEHLKVSERTLYRSFDQWVGVGPYKYFTLSRLHAFRRQLLAGYPHRGKITRAARDNGFDDLSRFAQLYKRHFGELPSETLAKHHELSGGPVQ